MPNVQRDLTPLPPSRRRFIVKDGGTGVKKSPLMPAWGKTLKDQEISNVISYIRSLAKPPYQPGK